MSPAQSFSLSATCRMTHTHRGKPGSGRTVVSYPNHLFQVNSGPGFVVEEKSGVGLTWKIGCER